MTGLKPGAKYYYSVGDAVAGFSSVQSFQTFPADIASAGRPLRIASIADMGYGSNSDGTVKQLKQLVDDGKVDMVIHNGDIGYADGDMQHWDVFMRKVEPD